MRFSYLRIWNARAVPITTIRTTHGQIHTLPVFSAVISAVTAAQTVPFRIGQKFWHIESTSAA